MSNFSWIQFLKHILIETEFILKSSKGKSFDDLQSDEVWQRAIVRSIEIIGEASKKVDPEHRAKYPQVEWKSMAQMRDKLIHDYFGVDYEIVWDVIINRIPELNDNLKRIVDSEPDN
ncbi:MAG: DUF86 domain-containing protein [Imperialibacter sp.]|uniref:HepT-like ribonuclease domain-containing protein n=1 Tax=Imperialibacter sp. TaxID=2038411 RepID=UPI0032F05EA9